jgi:MYXO-CTERM domain-containing protein
MFPSRPAAGIVARGLLALALAGSASASPFTVRPVAEYGDPAPGTGDSFIAFFSPVINDAGRVAFEGAILGSPRIWRESASGLEQVAAVGDVPAGSPDGAAILFFSEILFSNAGAVVVRAELDTGDEGYFSASPGGMATIAVEGQLAPGTTETFQRIDTSLRIGDAGDIAFYGALDTFSDPIGIWMGQAGTLSLLARQGDPAPGGGGDGFFILSDFPRISEAGDVGFASLLFGLAARAGLWKGSPGALAGLLVASMSDYRHAFLSDDEEWVFVDQSPSTTPRILAGVPGDFRTVYTVGDPAPGLPPGVGIAISSYRPDLRMNGSRQVALRAPTAETTPREGLWSEGSGTLELLALDGEEAPGTGGLLYEEIEGFAMNDLGQTAFLAELQDLAGHGLFLANPGEPPELVVREGGTFEVSPGDVRTVSDLDVVLESADFLRQRVRGGFNDAGELAFGLRFGFGSAGVYVVTVPEPGAAPQALLALLAVGGLARGRRPGS